MARIRYLKPDFFFDDDLADLKFEARLVFQGLWCHADKAGRLEDKPKVLKAKIMPFDKVNMDMLLFDLAEKFITRYEVDGRKYIQINSFSKHQKPHHTEKESTLPECNGALTVKKPLELGGNGEGNGEEEDKEKEKGFDSFWNLYPPRNGKKLEKGVCLKMFMDLNKDDIPKILEAVKNYADSKQIKDGIGIKDPKRFIQKDFWKEWIVPETVVPGKSDNYSLKEVDYTKGLEGFEKK
jgi:hypothetical protein